MNLACLKKILHSTTYWLNLIQLKVYMSDALILSRIQFAANITFHILFPAITIALSWVLLYFKLKHNKTKEPRYIENYRFWVKIFALCFALGVVSGVTMSFQFGTNWPGFMNTVGNIAGPLLAYEVLTAFFMEAVFLGIMLFGFNRVSSRVHTIATVLVAVGTTFSAFWILALNSWMQFPTGFKMIDGQAHVTSWLQVIFNPSLPYRLMHMLCASGLTAAFLVAGISAYRILKKDNGAAAKTGVKFGVYLAMILAPLQIFLGDLHGLNTLKYRPEKIAAMEALYETRKEMPLILFAIPDEKNQRNLYELALPKVGSLILTHHLDGEVKGLKEFAPDTPPVVPLFFGFRIMVGMGLLMLLISWVCGIILFKTSKLPPLLLKSLVAMTFSGWIATVAGWYVTEIGRQPFLVYQILRTKDAVTDVPSNYIGLTLGIYLITYLVLIISFISCVFYLAKKEAKHNMPAPDKLNLT